MRRLAALGIASLLLATGLGLAPVRATTQGGSLPAGPPGDVGGGQASPIAGTSRYVDGVWIHTDFVYDDYGADTGSWGQPNVVSLAGTSGDARYPRGEQYAGNAADIVFVRVGLHGRDLRVRVTLQTLLDPDVPAIWVQAGDEEHVFTSRNAEVDPVGNTVTFTLPGLALRPSVDLNVGAGLHDGEGGLRPGVPGTTRTSPDEITTGAPTDNRLFDLAFNTHEIEGRGGAWNEDVQSAALADGDLSPFVQTVDVGLLRRHHTTYVPDLRGYHVRLFESSQELGEGMSSSTPQYLGRWQPYAVWVPESYERGTPTPLFLNLHSLSSHHNQYRGGRSTTYTTFYEQTGDALGAVVVTPLGRGPDGWYEDEALVDTLEVWWEARSWFGVDRERTVVSGYSMGGYGTYRLTTLMPEAFASAVSVVGPPANGIWAHPLPPSGGADNPDNTHRQLESARNVPFWVTHGALDELVPVSGVQEQVNRMAELGHEHRFALHPAEDHLTFAVKDDWAREAAWLAEHLTRVRDPQHVTLRVRPASWVTPSLPDERREALLGHLVRLARAVGTRLNGAYWVGSVVPAGEGDVTASVDLRSGGIAHRVVAAEEVLTAGVDGPSPYRLTGLALEHGEEPTADVLSGTLRGVRSLNIDVGRAGLSDAPTFDVDTDGPVRIHLWRDGRVVAALTIGA